VRAGCRWLLALAALLSACHRGTMPPRPDGAAVVITAETQDDGIATVAEVEPNNTLAAAQPLVVTPTAPAAVAGAIAPPPAAGQPTGKRDVDLYRIDVPGPDGGVAPSGGDAGAMIPPPRLVLRADVRPAAPALAPMLEVLDATGRVLVAANGQPGESIAIPNLAGRAGTFYLRVRAAGPEAAAGNYRLVVRLAPFDVGAEVEPNGDAAHATELAPGGEAVGYLGWRRDQDWYRLPTAGLAEGSVLSVDLDPLPEVSVTLQLYGADAHKLTEARGRKGERVVLRNVRIAPTDPFVFVVVRADVGFSADARYNLRPRTDLPKAGTEAEPNDDQAHAQTIADGTVVGYLARGDVDFFRYSSDGMALLDVEVSPPERGGVEIEVTREDKTLLARAASARHAPARITGQLIPGGPILIRVVPRHGTVDSDDPYRLTVTSRAAPAPGDPAPKSGTTE
jgi:hypothetical protein